MKNLLIDLPEDFFINNILLSKALPIKSLLSLKCVCKYLRSLITSTAFINMHLHHSTTSPPGHHEPNNQLVLVDSVTPYDVFYSLKFNDGDDPCRPEVIMFDYPINSPPPQIWGTCNGLLCLSTKTDDDKVCLWNPLTKEYKDLPSPLPSTEILPMGITKVSSSKSCGSITYGFGYDRFMDDYKIIRCQHFFGHLDGNEENYGNHISITEFQVYTLGTNTWRKISSTTADNNSYNYVLPLEHTFLNGALHWVMSRSKVSEAKIVSFDIEKEVFGEMQMPLISEYDYFFFGENIQVLRGCLCALEFNCNEKCCNIWMMMDHGVKESWTKLFTIVKNKIEALNDEIDFVMLEGDAYNVDGFIMPDPYCRLLRFCENGEILIVTDNILFIYNPTNNKARRVEIGEIGKYIFQTEIYIESLVSLNSGVYI